MDRSPSLPQKSSWCKTCEKEVDSCQMFDRHFMGRKYTGCIYCQTEVQSESDEQYAHRLAAEQLRYELSTIIISAHIMCARCTACVISSKGDKHEVLGGARDQGFVLHEGKWYCPQHKPINLKDVTLTIEDVELKMEEGSMILSGEW